MIMLESGVGPRGPESERPLEEEKETDLQQCTCNVHYGLCRWNGWLAACPRMDPPILDEVELTL